jgi:pimeloyl-ACP methyl ester carboxylesterase
MRAAVLAGVVAALGWGAVAVERVEIRSTFDGKMQPALAFVPPGEQAVPLVVFLHSWSAHYDAEKANEVPLEEARRRGWAWVAPEFRGPNDHPEACGSDEAVQDVLDAVEWMKRRRKIDERRIYVMGGSGGGYMTLVMVGRAPQVWAAASAWVPISDLAAWYEFSKSVDSRYWKMMEGCFGGSPVNNLAQQEYRRRSPVYFLRQGREVPLDIQAGIRDGHTGSVPVSHSLRAFNAVAAPAERISDADIEAMTRLAAVPAGLKGTVINEERIHPVLFRRASGRARVTVFDGGHDTDFRAAMQWLEQHEAPAARLVVAVSDYQVLARQGDGAVVPGEAVEGLEVSVNGGPFGKGYPRLKTGGPYRLDIRLVRQGREVARARREGILVGDLYLLAGQSNMVGRAPLKGVLGGEARVAMLAAEDVWMEAREPLHEGRKRADGVEIGAGLGLAFARELVRRTGVPVGLIPCAKGGTSLAEWSPAQRAAGRRSLYGNLVGRARLAGGPFRGVLWYQGENDAGNLGAAATYGERWAEFVKQLREDLGQAELPVYTAQLGRYAVEPKPELVAGWNTVREAQRQAALTVAGTAVVATVDLTLTDSIHLDGEALQELGRRFAGVVLGEAAPQLAWARWETASRVRVHFSRPVKGKVLSQSFQLLNGKGEPVYGVFHAGTDERGDVVLGVAGAAGARRLAYGWGLDPVASLPGVTAFVTDLDSHTKREERK